MKENVLVAVLLTIGLVTPFFAWLLYIWYRSHVARMHQEGQIFNRRDRDRAQANYQPANGAQTPTFGPYFTPRGWVRPKTRGLSHDVRPPQYVHPRNPNFTSNPNSDQPFQGPNQATTNSPPHAVNRQPNPLSKRQRRKQRALQNKQKQQQEREQQQSQNNQRGKQTRNQRKQRNKNQNQGQNHQKSHASHSPAAHGAQDEQHDSWGNTEAQNDRTSTHGGGGWGNDEVPHDNRDNTGHNDNNKDWGNNFNNNQGGQRNSGSGSLRRGSGDNHNSPREKIPRWNNSRPASPDRASGNDAEFLRGNWGQSDDGAKRDSHSRSNHSNEDHNRWGDDDAKSYHQKSKRNHYKSPDRQSRKNADARSGWGQSDNGTRQNSPQQSIYPDEDRNCQYGWGDNYAKGYYKKSKGNRHGSPERKSRGRSSPNRDWGQSDRNEGGNDNRNRSRSNSWRHAEKRRGGGSPTWSQDGNLHRDKKKKKERWQIELEENMKMRHSRSRSRDLSDAGWDNRGQDSGWKETQKW
ncbi:hypothetical protein PITC_098470 [Penicillium italicum]|uniref:Uncharacterized protein n=1 Tax=Penicillium italicum TaxID=40296 RepID=A0A0A2L1U1_PENIT|nr:hypothetical protein PITC_098470 [Penicillium italicum]